MEKIIIYNERYLHTTDNGYNPFIGRDTGFNNFQMIVNSNEFCEAIFTMDEKSNKLVKKVLQDVYDGVYKDYTPESKVTVEITNGIADYPVTIEYVRNSHDYVVIVDGKVFRFNDISSNDVIVVENREAFLSSKVSLTREKGNHKDYCYSQFRKGGSNNEQY